MVFGLKLESFLRGAHSHCYQGNIHETMKMCPACCGLLSVAPIRSFHRKQWQIFIYLKPKKDTPLAPSLPV